jgi:Sulfotransferase family
MKSPIFIVGCPRSGTSYLYHLLLSAGGFASFHTQMNVFDVLEPIYGDLSVRKNKEAMMREWLSSKAFEVSGLDATEIDEKVMAECNDGRVDPINAGSVTRVSCIVEVKQLGVRPFSRSLRRGPRCGRHHPTVTGCP